MWLLWGWGMNKMKHWCTRDPVLGEEQGLWEDLFCSLNLQLKVNLSSFYVIFFMVELTVEITEQNWPEQIKYLGEEYLVFTRNVSNNWSASRLRVGKWQNACQEELDSSLGTHYSPSLSFFQLLSLSTTLSCLSPFFLLPSFISFLSKWWGQSNHR